MSIDLEAMLKQVEEMSLPADPQKRAIFELLRNADIARLEEAIERRRLEDEWISHIRRCQGCGE